MFCDITYKRYKAITIYVGLKTASFTNPLKTETSLVRQKVFTGAMTKMGIETNGKILKSWLLKIIFPIPWVR